MSSNPAVITTFLTRQLVTAATTASDCVVLVGWVLIFTMLVLVGVITQSSYAWLACAVAGAATALTLLGLEQAPALTIAEIIREAEQERIGPHRSR